MAGPSWGVVGRNRACMVESSLAGAEAGDRRGGFMKSDSGWALQAWVRALQRTAPIARHPEVTLPRVIQQLAERFGDSPALVDAQRTLSYRALAALANRYSRWALAHGLGPDDVVCLFMPNRAEYLAIWLGITGVGATV